MGEDWREQLVRIEPEHRSAAEAILSKLDQRQQPWGTKSELVGSRARASHTAFVKLVAAGVLVKIGGLARSPVFAIDRGEATPKLDTRKLKRVNKEPGQAKPKEPAKAMRAPKSPPRPVDLGPACRGIVRALAGARAPWLPKQQLCGSDKINKAAYQQLLKDGTLVELGKLGKTNNLVAASQGHAAADVQQALAVEIIVSRATPGGLVAMPADPKAPFWKQALPTKVRASFSPALKGLINSGRAVKLQGAGMQLFVLASSIQAAAAELAGHAAANASSPARPSGASLANGFDSERVRKAYRQLATRHRAVHVTIADLWRDSGAPLPALKSWLLAECQAHRADPALGEPSLATQEQLDAALVIDGKPHLYIQLENA